MSQQKEKIKELLGPVLVWQMGAPGPAPTPPPSVGGMDPEFLRTLDRLVKKLRTKKLKRAPRSRPMDRTGTIVDAILAVKALQQVKDRL